MGLQGFASGDLEKDATAVRMFTDAGVELLLSQVGMLSSFLLIVAEDNECCLLWMTQKGAKSTPNNACTKHQSFLQLESRQRLGNCCSCVAVALADRCDSALQFMTLFCSDTAVPTPSLF